MQTFNHNWNFILYFTNLNSVGFHPEKMKLSIKVLLIKSFHRQFIDYLIQPIAINLILYFNLFVRIIVVIIIIVHYLYFNIV